MSTVFKIFLSGISVLFFAVLANLIATGLGLTTWYGFIEKMFEMGLSEALKSSSVLSLIFMSVIYPLILGAAGYLVFYFMR